MAGKRQATPSVMGGIFEGPDSVMGRLFDGPDSVLGRLFGDSSKAHRPQIRIRLNREQAAKLAAGEPLLFRALGNDIHVIPEGGN